MREQKCEGERPALVEQREQERRERKRRTQERREQEKREQDARDQATLDAYRARVTLARADPLAMTQAFLRPFFPNLVLTPEEQ